MGCLLVARIGISALQSPCNISIERHRPLGLSYCRIAQPVAPIKRPDVPRRLFLPVRQILLLHHDDATECFRTIPHRFCTLDYLYRATAVLVNLRCVIGSPLLSGLSCAVVHNQDPIAIHTVDDRFSHRRTRLYRTHATYVFQKRRERFTHRSVNHIRCDFLAHTVYTRLPAFSCNNDFFNLLFFSENRLLFFPFLCSLCRVCVCYRYLISTTISCYLLCT